MAWIESHQALRTHPKTRKAARALGIPAAHLIGHLHCLWHWALDLAEDGDLSKFDADDLAIASEWEGDPQEFVQALIDCGPGDCAGFLEVDGTCGAPEEDRTGELVLHDWWDYAGKLVARRQKDRARKADERAARDDDGRGNSTGRRGGVRGTSDGQSDGHDAEVRGTSDGQAHDGPEDSRSREPTRPTNQQDTSPGGAGNDAGASPSEIDEQFEDFWRRYPPNAANGKPGGGGSKKKSRAKWKRLKQRERDAALAAVDNYAADCKRNGTYPAHVVTWLNQERWEEWQDPGDNVRQLKPREQVYVRPHVATDAEIDAIPELR